MKFYLSICVAIGLSSCSAVGPDYEPPTIETHAEFDVAGQKSLSAEEIATWWQSFGDEQLTRLVDEVLESNLDLNTAVERVDAARAAYGIVAADRLPTLNASGSYFRAKSQIFSPQGQQLGSLTQNQWSVGGNVSWEIDLFGRVRRSVESSLASFEANVEDARGVQVALAAETVATYFRALSLAERLGIATRNVEGQSKSLSIAEQRFGAGMAAGLDPAQARVNLHSTQASVPALELELLRALHRLAVLRGDNPRALIDELETDTPLPAVPTDLMVGLPQDLLRNRPDVRALERQLAAQTAQVGVAVAARYPAISLSGSWEWLSRSTVDLFDSNSETGNIGFPVSIPIFNAGRLRSQVSAEEAVLRQVDLQLRQQVLLAQEEVENALVAIVRDRRQAELLALAVDAARSSVSLSRELYTAGQSDFQNVLDAQRSLFSLEDDLARAQLNTMLDLVDLYLALGGGWALSDVSPNHALDWAP